MKIEKGWGQLKRHTATRLSAKYLGPNESKILWVIIHHTIAFNKTEDKIPYKQFTDMTGIDKRHQDRSINALIKKDVIYKKGRIFGLCRELLEIKRSPVEVTEQKVTTKGQKVTTKGQKVTTKGQKVTTSGTLLRASPESFSREPFLKRKKRKEFLQNFKEEDLEKNKKKALDMVEGLKKKFDKKGV